MKRKRIICIFLIVCSWIPSVVGFHLMDTIDSIQVDSLDQLYEEENTPTFANECPIYEQKNFDPNFREKYQGNDFNYAEKEKRPSWIEKFFEWLFGGDQNEGSSDILHVMIWFFRLLLAIGLVYGLYIFMKYLFNKQDIQWIFNNTNKNTLQYIDDSNSNLEVHYEPLLEEAIVSGNYRSAIRYMYLIVLQRLNAKNIIVFHLDKTNRDYIHEINHVHIKDAFRYVSYIYENIWYGSVEIDKRQFDIALSAFEKTKSIL